MMLYGHLKQAARLAGMALQLAWRASPHLMLGILCLLVVQALLSPLQLALSRAVLDRAAFDLRFVTAVDPLTARLPLAVWIALAAVAVAAGQLVQPFALTFQSLVGDRLTAYVSEQLVLAANRWHGLQRFEDPTFADDLERARKQAARSGLELMLHGTSAALSLLTAVSLILVLVALHPLAPLLLALATLPRMALEWEVNHRTGSHLYEQTPEARRLQYTRDLLLTPEPAKDVRLYELGPFLRQRYDTIFTRVHRALDRLRRRLLISMAFADAFGSAVAAGIYVYVVWLVAVGERTVGDVALYGGAATMLYVQLFILGSSISFMPTVFSFLPSLFRVLHASPDLSIPDQPRAAPRPIKDGIIFQDVAFTYPGQTTPVLQGVSFQMRPGESIALAGHNGAGKTTIVKLLLRLYDPSAGRILLDGVELREYDIDDLRRQMGVVFQDFVRYELTPAHNVGFGQVEALDDRQRQLRALEQAGATSLLHKLPQGLDTPLGREFGGRELSGGEWQKLALAHAFMREGQVLVLDEPTAALDVQTEYEVYLRFHELTRDRMTLLISHRFSTIRMADHILYLADGTIKESGSHAELIARGGEYARLYELQAARYLANDE